MSREWMLGKNLLASGFKWKLNFGTIGYMV